MLACKRRINQNFFFNILILFVGFMPLICYPISDTQKTKAAYSVLKKTGEIREGFTTAEHSYFWHIDSICHDDEDNLYIADSGWNKIFIFNEEGKFVSTFGQEGQGPGEFLADPRGIGLKITFGNDKKLYVVDKGNQRLSVFSKKGKFIKQFKLPRYLHDSAVVNSRGDIYLISQSKEQIIDCYDKSFKLKKKFLDLALHFEFPILQLPQQARKYIQETKYVSDKYIKKVITREDHIIILSNYALKIFHCNENNELINSFSIDNEIFIEDFKKRLSDVYSREGFILPFELSIDNEENIYLSYLNGSSKRREIYRYKLDGEFIDILRFPNVVGNLFCINNSGKIFVIKNKTVIEIYEI